MPPPEANEQSLGPQNPEGRSCCDATVFSLTTLSLIVTVAPVVKPAACGIRTPPPCVTAWSGTEELTPPVIVTPLIAIVGSVGANSFPSVSTGAPPLMVVAPAPAPRTSTLTSIVTPPANVPGPIVTVSPSWAALTAAWIVEKQPAPPTHSVAARAEDAVAPEPTSAAAAAETARIS